VSRKQPSLLRLSFDLWRAGVEAQQVIGWRIAKLMGGGSSAAAEMNRMVSEKVAVAIEAHQVAARAALSGRAAEMASRTVALYRRKMRANCRRLGAVNLASKPHHSRRARPK
jgi:aspartate/methionine/tyrosine aminotransferase